MSYFSQPIDQPLYEDILWNKPETKSLAGKLLIIGGNSHSIVAPSKIYSQALSYGAGEARVVLPNATLHYFKQAVVPHDIIFAESTPSGSFSSSALQTLRTYSQWADFLVIAGDMTKNSETTTLTAELLAKSTLTATITGDSIDALQPFAEAIFSRKGTICIMTFGQLQKYAQAMGYHTALTSTLTHNRLIAWLEEFSQSINAVAVLLHAKSVYTAAKGSVIATQPFAITDHSTQHIAAASSVWAMQHPARTTEAIATAITQIIE